MVTGLTAATLVIADWIEPVGETTPLLTGVTALEDVLLNTGGTT